MSVRQNAYFLEMAEEVHTLLFKMAEEADYDGDSAARRKCEEAMDIVDSIYG